MAFGFILGAKGSAHQGLFLGGHGRAARRAVTKYRATDSAPRRTTPIMIAAVVVFALLRLGRTALSILSSRTSGVLQVNLRCHRNRVPTGIFATPREYCVTVA